MSVDPTPAELLQTPLHALHLELGARMVAFAGYAMPVQYPDGLATEHRRTRAAAGLFDVSHMGQLRIHGAGAAAALESLVPVDVAGLALGRQRYGFLTAEDGGILDDLMITRRRSRDGTGEELFVVVNAACKAEDLAWMRARIGAACTIEEIEGQGLLAVQGPRAVDAVRELLPGVEALRFMDAAWFDLPGGAGRVFVSRSGYTGEDGFEISVDPQHCEDLARALLAHPDVSPVGLGARDSLRLEAGLCLYGHDIDRGTTPIEAGLSWAIQKVRRHGGARAGGFPGAELILAQLDDPARLRRVRIGLRGLERAPMREGTEIVDAAGTVVGRVTSGSLTPTADAAIAMAYVTPAAAAPDTELWAVVRGRRLPVRACAMPFVPHRYARA